MKKAVIVSMGTTNIYDPIEEKWRGRYELEGDGDWKPLWNIAYRSMARAKRAITEISDGIVEAWGYKAVTVEFVINHPEIYWM